MAAPDRRGFGSALVRAAQASRPAGADWARTGRGIRGLGGADSRLVKRGIPGWLVVHAKVQQSIAQPAGGEMQDARRYSPASYFHLHLTLLSTTLTQRRDGVFKCSQSLTQFKKPRSTI